MAMYDASVRAAVTLTPHLRRITLHARAFADFQDDGPDQRVKLLLPRAGQRRPHLPAGDQHWYRTWRAMPVDSRPVLRTYTVRRARPAAEELDVDIVLHGDSGPGSSWALRAAPGDRVGVFGAYAEYEAPARVPQLIAGDHCALPAIAAILERLPHDATGHTLIEIPSAAERIELDHPPGVAVRWVHGEPHRPGAALLSALTAAPLTGTGYAWVAADQATAAAARRHLVRTAGLPPQQIMFMGYWRTDGAIDDVA